MSEKQQGQPAESGQGQHAQMSMGRFQSGLGPFGPWTINRTRDVFANSFVRMAVDDVTRPDGKPGEHVVVAIKPGVCVLALDDGDHLLLTREFHYAIGRDSLEAVSGGIDPGETALECARRELQEELGLVAEKMEYLTTVDPFTSIMVSPTQIFLATGLSRVEAAPEATELITEARVPLKEAVRMVSMGEISHAPSCVGVLLLATRSGR